MTVAGGAPGTGAVEMVSVSLSAGSADAVERYLAERAAAGEVVFESAAHPF
jgi:hypothetical protein